jgi:predicted Zn-dependent protease
LLRLKGGVLVTRLWYIREVDPYEKIVTGMTRDGTFLVENGKVQCAGLRNFRFNQSLIAMLSNVETMSESGSCLRRGIVRYGRARDESEGL